MNHAARSAAPAPKKGCKAYAVEVEIFEMGLTNEDLKDFRTWLDEAIIRMEEVAEHFTDERLLKQLRQQLDFLFSVTRNGHLPTRTESRRFALGLTARRLEEVDERLSRLLSRMSNYLDSDEY